MEEVKNELWAALLKLWGSISTWFLLIGLGLLGMIGHNLHTGKKMSFARYLGSIMVAIFVGILTSILCYVKQWDRLGTILVPVMTLVSEKVILAIYSFEWQNSIKEFIKGWISKWK